MLTTICNFERGEAKEPLTGMSYYDYVHCFALNMTSVNALANLLEVDGQT